MEPGSKSVSTAGEVHALEALHALLGEVRFWRPETLAQASAAALKGHIEKVSMAKPSEVDELFGLRDRAAWERLSVAAKHPLLKAGGNSSEMARRALAFAALCPLEAVDGHFYDSISLVCSELSWLPKGLVIPSGCSVPSNAADIDFPRHLVVGESLNLAYCGRQTRLPADLVVKGNLILDGCGQLMDVPEGLVVRGRVILEDSEVLPTGCTPCPWLQLDEEDLRTRAWIGGKIVRNRA